ncbi:COMD9-like protein [Mya arenaria]|uniref:COMD9-like protein n=1 Tax=Mya arenaria TaxID=6604 RepID=A0ABY7E223_MYAAR|nr:COMD9-like protein [Mya arenaria]
MAAVVFTDLTILTQAPSKDVVLRTCQWGFLYRDRQKVPESVLNNLVQEYGVTMDQARKVQENPLRVDQVADVSTVNVELSKETLDTMLDGLSKIRDQLSSVANRYSKDIKADTSSSKDIKADTSMSKDI